MQNANRRLRVLQLVNTLNEKDGGPARNSFELNQALNSRDDVSALLVSFRPITGESVVLADPERAIRAPRPATLNSIRTGRDFQRTTLLGAIRYTDVIVVHGYYLGWVPLVHLAARLQGKPVLHTPHGSLTRYQRAEAKVKKALWETAVGWAIRANTPLFVVGSQAEQDQLLEKYPQSATRVAGVGTTPPSQSRTRITPDSTIRLLSVSRVAPKKRIDLMIDALAELRDRSFDANLTIAGTGDPGLLAALESQIRRLGLDGQVRFAGHVAGAQKAELFLTSDVFLLPSDDENFGIGVAEALAHGLPCIASANVASGQILSGLTGTVVPEPDGRRIANSVVELASAADWHAVRSATRTAAERHYGWSAVGERWATICREVWNDQKQLGVSNVD